MVCRYRSISNKLPVNTSNSSATYWCEKTMNWRTDICWWIHLKNGNNTQLQDKYPTSTSQVQDKLNTDNPNVIRLVQVVGEKELSVKEIMDRLGLKDRKNILNLYLTPSMKEGYIRQLHPQSPRHPRQKYLLTVKGLALYNELSIWNTSNRGAKVKPWLLITNWKWKLLMVNRKEIRNSTAEFLIFQIEGIYHQWRSVWLTKLMEHWLVKEIAFSLPIKDDW